MLCRFRKGQSPLEYTVLIILLMGAFLAAGNYFKRGVQGRWMEVSDGIGDQYDPRYGNGSVLHTLMSNTQTRIDILNIGNAQQTVRTDSSTSLELKQGFITTGAY